MVARKTSQYVGAALDSLTLAVEIFNRPSPVGREHATVMLAAHSFEMLLKAAIYEDRKSVSFSGSDRSFDLGKCVLVAETDLKILDRDDRVLLLALKEDRDCATHDVIGMSEDVLWLHLRSAVTIFRKVLRGLTGQDLTEVLPGRVMPVSAVPPSDVGLVMGREFEQIRALLGPGKRKGAEARARLIPLLALDNAAQELDKHVTEADLRAATRALKQGSGMATVLPGIDGLRIVGFADASERSHEITLRVDPKRGKHGLRPAAAGEDALTYREVNTFDKFSLRLSKFGEKLGLTRDEGLAVVYALGLKSDPDCYLGRFTPNGGVTFQGLSNVALERAKTALKEGLDVQEALTAYRKFTRSRSRG